MPNQMQRRTSLLETGLEPCLKLPLIFSRSCLFANRLHCLTPWGLVKTRVLPSESERGGGRDSQIGRWVKRGVSAPIELVKTIVPLCLSRLCLSAWRGLILARACSRWFIKMGPGKTRGPGGEKNFDMHAQCSQMGKNTWSYNTTIIHTLKTTDTQARGSHQGTTPKLRQYLKVNKN